MIPMRLQRADPPNQVHHSSAAPGAERVVLVLFSRLGTYLARAGEAHPYATFPPIVEVWGLFAATDKPSASHTATEGAATECPAESRTTSGGIPAQSSKVLLGRVHRELRHVNVMVTVPVNSCRTSRERMVQFLFESMEVLSVVMLTDVAAVALGLGYTPCCVVSWSLSALSVALVEEGNTTHFVTSLTGGGSRVTQLLDSARSQSAAGHADRANQESWGTDGGFASLVADGCEAAVEWIHGIVGPEACAVVVRRQRRKQAFVAAPAGAAIGCGVASDANERAAAKEPLLHRLLHRIVGYIDSKKHLRRSVGTRVSAAGDVPSPSGLAHAIVVLHCGEVLQNTLWGKCLVESTKSFLAGRIAHGAPQRTDDGFVDDGDSDDSTTSHASSGSREAGGLKRGRTGDEVPPAPLARRRNPQARQHRRAMNASSALFVLNDLAISEPWLLELLGMSVISQIPAHELIRLRPCRACDAVEAVDEVVKETSRTPFSRTMMVRLSLRLLERRQTGIGRPDRAATRQMQRAVLLEHSASVEAAQDPTRPTEPQIVWGEGASLAWGSSSAMAQNLEEAAICSALRTPPTVSGGIDAATDPWRLPHVSSLTHFLTECRRMRKAFGQCKDPHERLHHRRELRAFWYRNVEDAVACCVNRGREFSFIAGHALADDQLHLPLSSMVVGLESLITAQKTCCAMDVMLSLRYLARELAYLERSAREGEGSEGPTEVDAGALLAFRTSLANFGVERVCFFFCSSSRSEPLGPVDTAVSALEFLAVIKTSDMDPATLVQLMEVAAGTLPLLKAQREVLSAYQRLVESPMHAARMEKIRGTARERQARGFPHVRARGDSKAVDSVGDVRDDSQRAIVLSLLRYVAPRAWKHLNVTSIVQAFALLRIFTPLLSRTPSWESRVRQELQTVFPEPPPGVDAREGDLAGAASAPPAELAGYRRTLEVDGGDPKRTSSPPPAHTEDGRARASPHAVRRLLRRARRQQLHALDAIAYDLCRALMAHDSALSNPYHFLKVMAALARLPPSTLSQPRRAGRSRAAPPGSHGGTIACESGDTGPLGGAPAWVATSRSSSPPREQPTVNEPAEVWEYLVAKSCIFVHCLAPSQRCTLGHHLEAALVELRATSFSHPDEGRRLIAPFEAEMKQYPADYEACFVRRRQPHVIPRRMQRRSR